MQCKAHGGVCVGGHSIFETSLLQKGLAKTCLGLIELPSQHVSVQLQAIPDNTALRGPALSCGGLTRRDPIKESLGRQPQVCQFCTHSHLWQHPNASVCQQHRKH